MSEVKPSVKTAAAVVPVVDLAIASPLTDVSQAVQDQTGVASPLWLSTKSVTLREGGAVANNGPHVLNIIVPRDSGTRASMLIRGEGPEASIRYHAGNNDAAWNVGTLDSGRFFFWSGQQIGPQPQDVVGFVMTIDALAKTVTVTNLTIERTLTVNGLTANGTVTLNGSDMAITALRPATAHPNPGTLEQVMVDPATGQLFHQ